MKCEWCRARRSVVHCSRCRLDRLSAPHETLAGVRLCQRCYERFIVDQEPIQ